MGRGATPSECVPVSLRSYYVRYTGSGGCRLLAGGLVEGLFAPPVVVAGFSGDGRRVVFESEADLLAGEARAGVVNVYEGDLGKPVAEQLSLVGVLPAGEGGGAPAGGSVAGEGSIWWPSFPAHANGGVYTQSAVSGDGSRVVFTALPSERVYVRENAGAPASPVGEKGECLVAVDACTVAVSVGAAHFREATPDGGFVYYTEGENLYRFDVEDGQREAVSTGAAGVLGVLGSSADGSSVYFAATGVLAGNESEHHEKASEGEEHANLYEWHETAGGGARVTFIAPLATFDSEERDWSDELGPGAPDLQKSARVTPDGGTLLFASIIPLTGYNDVGDCEGISPCLELYRYRAGVEGGVGSLVCVSCDPSNAPPVGNAQFDGETEVDFGPRAGRSLTRNLSDDGDRVFFQTPDALLASDTNRQVDVYEWEADGEGSCHSESQDHGCLYLISTGNSSEQSYFGDASANGDSVFFFARQNLTGVDSDNNVHVFDARVCEHGEPCEEPEGSASGRPVSCSGEGCLGSAGRPPAFPAPASSLLTGAGNLTPPPPPATGSSKPPTKPLTRRQRLAAALKVCRTKHNRHRRTDCEVQAHKRYGARTALHVRSGAARRP